MSTVASQSMATAYASKPNIVVPSASAVATAINTAAATRLTDDPNAVVFGTQTGAVVGADASTAEVAKNIPVR